MSKTLFNPVQKRAEILCEHLAEDYDSKYPTGSDGDFCAQSGRRYFKIVHGGRSVHAFVDKTTGDVFKPASWRGPAKIARYNLLDDASYQKCLSRADWAGGYLYIR